MTQTSGTGDGSGAAGVGAVDRRNVELRYQVLAAQREGNRKLSRDLAAIDLTPAQAEVHEVQQAEGRKEGGECRRQGDVERVGAVAQV